MAGPVTGKFQADFDSFYSAVEKAQVSLRSFEGDSAKVERQINRMADSFSGRKVIQESTLMAEAIREIGGVSKLSTDEAARALRTLEQGMEKMLKTGEQIPTSMMKTAAELRRVGRASEEADAAVNRITQSYREYDGILQSLGINIGPYVKGLQDVTNLVTKGIPALGAFSGAAVVVGTAVASWKLGEKIGEVTGWTDAIARGTAALKGYGDMAQQVKLAQMQSSELTGHAEKMWALQAKTVADATKAAEEHTAELRREGMVAAGNLLHFEATRNQLEKRETQLRKDAEATRLAAHEQFFFGEKTKETTATIEKQTVALDARQKSLDAIKKKADEEKARIDAFMNAPTLNDREAQSATFDLPNLTNTQLKHIQAEGDPFQKDTTGELGIWRKLRELEDREGTIRPTDNATFFALQREAVLLAQLRRWAEGRERPPGFAGGVENFAGGLAYVHKDEMLVNMPRGTSVIPAGKASTGIVIGPIHIQANTRAGGEDAGRAFVTYLRQTGQLLPAGVGA